MAVTGANAITTSFITDFTSNVEHLVQQRGSKLRGTVRVENFTGKDATYMEQFGEVAAVQRTNRHADTPLVPTPYDRRWVYPKDWEVAELVDDQDRLRQIINPNDPVAVSQAFAIGRACDDEIIEEILVANNTGETGGTSTIFTAANLIANASLGFTIDKLRDVVSGMEDANVDFENDEVFCILSPQQKQDLLESTEVTSSDYNTVKALVQGQVDSFLGMKFVGSNRILGATDYNGSQTITATHHRALIYCKNGVGLGIWDDMQSRMDERPDKSYSTQIYTKSTFGATRLQEKKVWAIDSVHA